MTSTVYVDFSQPAVNAAWLNDVNNLRYGGSTSTGSALLPFQPTATGAAVRTVGSKLQDFVNLTDFTGADPTGATDSTTAINNALAVGKPVYLSPGTWKFNANVAGQINLFGDSADVCTVLPFDTAIAAVTYRFAANGLAGSSIQRINFLSPGTKVGVGVTCSKTDPANYVSGDENVGGLRFYDCRFNGFDKGVQFPFGNILDTFYSCDMINNRYGIYCLNNKYGSDMHAGAKYFYSGSVRGNDVGLYIHNTVDGFGGIDFTGTIFEDNKINSYIYTISTRSPVVFRNVWNENSGSLLGGSTNVDQWTGTTKTTTSFVNRSWIFDGALSNYVFENVGVFSDVNLIATSSRVIANQCHAERFSGFQGGECSVADVNSQIIMVDPDTDGGVPVGPRCFVEGNFMARRLTLPADSVNRWALVRHRASRQPHLGGTGFIQRCTNKLVTTGLVVTGTLVPDGILHTQCNDFSVSSGTAGQFASVPDTTFTPPANSWTCVTLDVLWTAGVAPSFNYGNQSNSQLFQVATVPVIGEWYTIGAVAQLPSTPIGLFFAGNASSGAFRLSAVQGRTFGTREEAQSFLTSLSYAEVGNDFQTITYSASISVDAADGSVYSISATNGAAFTINAPTSAFPGQTIRYVIRNTSGTTLGTITWDAVFKMSSWTSPANGFSRSISFNYNGTNWVEVQRTTVDIPD